jgi:hypothetical protein
VTVTNPDGDTASGTGIFTVDAAPTVTSTSPSSEVQGAVSQTVTITGTGFASGATVAFSGTGITVNSTTFVSATSLSVNLSVAAGAATGARNVTVTNPDAGVGTKNGAFTVDAAPTVTAVSPASRGQGAVSQTVTITGTGFVSGATAAFSGSGITVNSTSFVNATTLRASITISATAATGAGDVTVTNPDAGQATGTGLFTVNPGPTVTSASPNAGIHGTSLTVSINGTGFVSGATVAFSNTRITVNSTTFVSATAINVTITIAANAPVGAGNVTVTNPDAGTATGTGAFTVN